jgi:hypothetical protein
MKHTNIVYFSILIFLISGMMACHSDANFSETTDKNPALSQQLPKALFITTGLQNGNGTLPKGMVIALQALNQKGVVCRMETREILYNRDQLFQYNILVLSTALGYHDADRTYSLSFMADEELEMLREFVAAGGVLIAGDNVGRNYPDGTDRVVVFQRLTPENFPLADCLGGTLEERFMDDHQIELKIGNQLEGTFRERPAHSKWTLVMDSILSDSIKILGEWKLGAESLPAITQNRFRKGTAYLLATSDFLEPVHAGGEFSTQQISDFYHYVIDDFQQRNHILFELNPWPNNYQQAFCVSLNAFGTLNQYQRIFNYLDQEDLQPVIFTNGLLDQKVKTYLKDKKAILQSSGYGYQRYGLLNYPEALNDMVKNENHWERQFSGFRFPYTTPSYWGLMVLEKKGVQYESSIGANNLSFFHGAVVPYNLVISNDHFFTTTDIMEIAPVYHDDYHFYQDFLGENEPRPKDVEKAVELYEDYLLNFWETGVQPYHGALVYLGHPAYIGKSDTTLTPLKSLITRVKQENTWLTTLDEIARFRQDLSQFSFFVEEDDDGYMIRIHAPEDIKIENLSLRIPFELKDASAKWGSVQVKKVDQSSYVIFTGEAGQEVRVCGG